MSNIEKAFDLTTVPESMLINTIQSEKILRALWAVDDDMAVTDTDLRIAIVNFLFVKINETMLPSTLTDFKGNLEFLAGMADASLDIQRGAANPPASLPDTPDSPASQLLAAPPVTDEQAALRHEYDQIAIAGNVLQNACHGAAHRAGWWNHTKTGFDLRRVIRKPEGPLEELLAGLIVSQKLMLAVTELAEAMEGDRKNLMDDKLPHRKMFEVEIADVIIRAMDLAGAANFDIGGAIAEKMAFNAHRPDHKKEAREAAGGKAY